MGNTVTVRKVNFEDIQYAIKNKNKCILINTLGSNEQGCLIKNTVPVDAEEKLINKYLLDKVNINIIVYDKNANAPNLMKKYNQLINLGFINVYIYPGGLFEWLLLQDVYGKDIFPTTYNELDILKFKGKSIFTSYLIKDLD